MPRHNSKAAKAQGGRDEEPLHIKFYKEDGVAKIRYKVTEVGDGIPYLPTHGGITVFKEAARDMIPGLAIADGPDAVVPFHAELLPWTDKKKVQHAILTKLTFVTKEHHEEWNTWFDTLPTVSIVMFACIVIVVGLK